MSTSNEQRSAFLMKRMEFRTYIKRAASAQREDKDSFRALKLEVWSEDREKRMQDKRQGIVTTKHVIRHLLLAYAMFRGKSYAKVEQKTKEAPSPYMIWKQFQKFDLGEKYCKANIEMWLDGKTLPKIELPPLPELPELSLEEPMRVALP